VLAWDDLKVLADTLVYLGRDDFDLGECAADPMDALWSCYEGQEEDLALLHPLLQQYLENRRTVALPIPLFSPSFLKKEMYTPTD